jgi:glycosyltransferase involved in cell wall biosynthesis
MRKDCGVLAFTSGFMHRDWGILHAARALHAIRDLNPGLVVAHSGVTDPEYEAQVRAAVPDARRLLIYGELPHDRFLAVLAAADVYIRASLYDGDSLAVREALDLGKAVIASDCAVRPAGCALFQTGSQESLDSALRSAVRQPRFDQARPDQQGSTELLELYADLLAGAGKTARMTAA